MEVATCKKHAARVRATRSIPLNPNADFGEKMAAMFRRSLSACLATGPIPRRKPEAARTGSSPSHLYTIALVAERCLHVASSMSMDGYWISLHSLSSTKAPPLASPPTRLGKSERSGAHAAVRAPCTPGAFLPRRSGTVPSRHPFPAKAAVRRRRRSWKETRCWQLHASPGYDHTTA